MFSKCMVINGEYIVKISRGIVDHVYEVKLFVVNAGMNIITNNWYLNPRKDVSLPEVFALF